MLDGVFPRLQLTSVVEFVVSQCYLVGGNSSIYLTLRLECPSSMAHGPWPMAPPPPVKCQPSEYRHFLYGPFTAAPPYSARD